MNFFCINCQAESSDFDKSTNSRGACRACGSSHWKEIPAVRKVIAVAADLEYTCFDKVGGDVLVTGLVEILEDFTLGREAAFYSRPVGTKYFTQKAQEIHGISYFKAQTFPERRDSCISMLQWLKPLMPFFPLKFIYHGTAKSDHGWLTWHFRKEDLDNSILKAFPESLIESTVTLARKHLKQLKSHKLNEVAEHYEIEINHHEALSDARACALIWCKIKQGEGTWTGQLL